MLHLDVGYEIVQIEVSINLAKLHFENFIPCGAGPTGGSRCVRTCIDARRRAFKEGALAARGAGLGGMWALDYSRAGSPFLPLLVSRLPLL